MDAYLSSSDGTRLVITVRGEIDLANAEQFLQRLLVLASPPAGQTALDLSRVTFMDCAGLRVLAVLERHLQAHGGSVRVSAASPEVARLFELAGPPSTPPRDPAPGLPRLVAVAL